MSNGWCAFTGWLMMLMVYLTYISFPAPEKPGVTKRWWDGTIEVIETYHPDGRVQVRTTYGDDGRSVVGYEEWSPSGGRLVENVRRRDGKMLEKRYDYEGNGALLYSIVRSADGKVVLEERTYHPNGQLNVEAIMADDSSVALDRRVYDEAGVLQSSWKLLPGADQENIFYRRGKKAEAMIVRANGDIERISYNPEGGMRRRYKDSKLSGQTEEETFSNDGKLVKRSVSLQGKDIWTIFVEEKPKLKYTFSQWQMVEIEELSPETGLPVRRLMVKQNDSVIEVLSVQHFRPDGTLSREKFLSGGTVSRQVDYDSTGKTVVVEIMGGEAETIDPMILKPENFLGN